MRSCSLSAKGVCTYLLGYHLRAIVLCFKDRYMDDFNAVNGWERAIVLFDFRVGTKIEDLSNSKFLCFCFT